MRQTNDSTKQMKWVDPAAPEYNKIFSTGTKSGGVGWGVGTTIANSYTVNGTTYRYENWNNGEPNNSSPETALQILTGGAGNWNDLNEDRASLPYVIEFGDSPKDNPTGGGSRTPVITWHY
jgi:hypothetical protein